MLSCCLCRVLFTLNSHPTLSRPLNLRRPSHLIRGGEFTDEHNSSLNFLRATTYICHCLPLPTTDCAQVRSLTCLVHFISGYFPRSFLQWFDCQSSRFLLCCLYHVSFFLFFKSLQPPYSFEPG